MAYQNYYSDNSNAFTAEVITTPNYLNDTSNPPETLKSGNYLYLFSSPRSTLKIYISYDGKAFEHLGTITEDPQRFDLGKQKFYYFQLKIVESSSNKPFEVRGYSIDFDFEPEKR